jgi:hypothetical protein
VVPIINVAEAIKVLLPIETKCPEAKGCETPENFREVHLFHHHLKHLDKSVPRSQKLCFLKWPERCASKSRSTYVKLSTAFTELVLG